MNNNLLSFLFGKRMLSLTIVLVLSTGMLFSQGDRVRINGTVIDTKGTPIAGATVTAKDASAGTATGSDGSFTLDLAPDAVVEIRFLGYRPEECAASELGRFPIVLQEDATSLGEVVVVGYGSQVKETLTGAISAITNSELNTVTSSNFAQSIQGKVSGLHVRQSSGEPGAFDTGITIRGFGTPLYVIDGVQIPLDQGPAEFQRLNPEDVESVSFLKDASASIYGRNGGNGAVIVTTRKGQKGKASFAYNGAFGIQQPTGMPAMANRSQWAQLRNEAEINASLLSGSSSIVPYYTPEQLKHEMTAPNTDWYGAVYKGYSTQTRHNLTASGGDDNTTYYVGLGYTRDNGLLKSGDLNYVQYSFRSNVTMKLAKNIRGEAFVAGRYGVQNSPVARQHNIFYGARTALPSSPLYANNNREYFQNQRFLHPLAISQSDLSGYQLRRDKNFSGTLNLIYDAPFLEGLSFKGVASYSNTSDGYKTLTKAYKLYDYVEGADIPYTGIEKNSPSNLRNSYNEIDKINLQAFATFSREFAGRHKVDASLIYEYDKFAGRTSSLYGKYDFFTIDQTDHLSKDDTEIGGMETDRLTSSLVGRFNYDYSGKYLLEFAFRYEGSYKYHPDIRWQLFPVVSAGWRVSEEEFMKNIDWLSNLKLRVSWGLAGSDEGFASHQYVDGYILGSGGGYAFTDDEWTTGIGMPSLLNPRLTWMKTRTADIGLDIGLLRNKIAIEADIFQRDVTGIPATRNLSLPNTFGAVLPQENLNHTRDLGFDVALAYNDNIGDFYFGVKGNFTMTRRQNIYIERGEFGNSYDKWRNGVNNRWNDFTWGYELEGRFGNDKGNLYAPVHGGVNGNTLILPGDYQYKDINGDGLISELDMIPLFHSGTPTYQYGLTLSGAWKGLDFSVLFQGSGGYTVRFREVYAEALAFELNTPAYFFDRWHREDPYDPDSRWISGEWPSTRMVTYAGANYNESEIWRRNATYIRLKNIDVGYTFPRKWFIGSGIESIRVYFNAQNILTITDSFVRPFDPEKIEGMNSSGFTYPVMRSFNFGVNINF